MVSARVNSVLCGFTNLSQEERAEFVSEVNVLLSAPPGQRVLREETIKKAHRISLGPKGDGCPCCGG